MTLPSSYKAGSITVSAGGTQVVGTGTNWTGFGVRAGDILWAGGIDVAVASVEGPTALTLAFPWAGPALSGSAYELRLTPDASRVLTASREAIASIEDFRGDIYASANVYPTTAAGLAATQLGAQFQVRVGDELVRYRKDASGATELARYMTGAAITAAVDRAVAVATPSYVSRDAALAAVSSLATSVTQIIVREGTALVVRSRTAFADDPLFSSGARWGVVQRQDVPAEATARAAGDAAVQADLADGRAYYLAAALDPSGKPVPTSAKMVIATHFGAGTCSLWRSIGAPAGGLETDKLKLDAAGRWWARVGIEDLSAEATARATADTALQTDLADGRTYYLGGTLDPSGRTIPMSAKLVMTNHNASNSYQVWRPVGAPAGELETDTVKKDAAGRWWVLAVSRSLSVEISDRTAGDIASRDRANHSGVQPITTINGLSAALDGLSQARIEGDAAEAAARNAAIITRVAPLEGPIRPVWDYLRGFWSLLRTTGNHTLLALTSTGLYFKAAAELLDDIAPQIAARIGFGLPSRAREIAGGHSLIEDRTGQTVLALRRTGLDGRWSDETVADLRTRMQITDPVEVDPLAGVDQGYITATVILTQSLMFMDGDASTPTLYPAVDPATALMIGGLIRSDRRGDGSTINVGLSGPRSMGYDTAYPGTGLVPAVPGADGNPTGAYYAVKGYNGWRRAFGLIQRRTVGVLWGQPGDHISRYNADPSDAPAPLVDSTNHWTNLMFWLDQFVRICAGMGVRPRLDLYSIIGTSAKQDADPQLHARTLRALIVAIRQACDARGIEDVTVYFSQPGGDTDTSHSAEHWEVTQSYLDLADEGYGVLVAPEFYLRVFDNNVHFDEAEGQRIVGMLNWARAAREAGRRFTIRRPVVSLDGLVVTLDYDSLWDGEMWEIDPADPYAGRGIDAHHGYTCDTATITSVELVGRRARITLAALPADGVPLWIDYAMQSQDVRALNDGFTAFRGRIVATSRFRDPLNPAIVHRRRMPSHSVPVIR